MNLWVVIEHNKKDVTFGPYDMSIYELKRRIENGHVKFPEKYMFDCYRIVKIEPSIRQH